jgi:hypothetical protein
VICGSACGWAGAAVWAGGSGGTVTVISSAESGIASIPLASNSQANNPFDLATVTSPKQKFSRLIIISAEPRHGK